MSELSILQKSTVIRNETQEFANTRGRIADVIDDLNLTKANKEDVDAVVQLIIEELGVSEQEIYDYIDSLNAHLEVEKIPYWDGDEFQNSAITSKDGKVGIGTDTPSKELEVNGSVKTKAIVLPKNEDAAIANRLRSDGTNLYFADENSIENQITFESQKNWKTIDSGSGTNFSIDYSDVRTRFKINSSTDIPKTLTSINFVSETTRAVEFWIYNDTNQNINIPESITSGLSKGFAYINTPFTIFPKAKALLKYNPEINLIECWKDNSSGGLSSVNVGTDLTGNGNATPLNLSASKNAEIAGKENASNKVTAWSTTPDNTHYPSEKLVKDSLDLIKPATQAEAESQTAPTTESNKYITTFSLWKWLQSLTYIILKPNFTTAIANRLRSDGNRPYYANNSAVERGLAYDDEKMNLPSTNGTFAIQKSGTDISFIPTFSTIENLFFDQNGKWAFPATGATSYSTLRTGNITQVGHTARASYFIPIIDYTFNTTNTISYRRGSTMYFTYTKVFKFIQQFDINSSVSTTRILVGLSNMFGSVNPTNVSADTLIRTIGVCKVSSSSNLSWIWNDATGSANVEDMGSGFPANDFNSIYRLTIDSSTAGVSVSMRLDRINKTTGAITSATKILTSDFYVTDTLYPILYCCDSASTGTGLVGDYGIIGYTNLV